ncbi:MAG: citrate transporter [Bacilli bacterium]|nr:citrate transporter [Bacilli bacterium]
MYIKQNIKNSVPSMLLIAIVFVLSTIASLVMGIPVSEITQKFNYSVIVILIIMELFTNLIVETGIMQFLATKLALVSKGGKKLCIFLFGILMFFISAFLNNITAVMMVLPVIFVLLKALNADKKYIAIFFAVILALSNTGGAASPIGDFPAIVIMTSGITTFTGYLFRAFPLFLITSIVLLILWSFFIKDKNDSKTNQKLAVELLQSRYRNNKVRLDILIPLGIIMLAMFIAWSVVPQNIIPPEMIALLGYVIGLVFVSAKNVRIKQTIDMKSVLMISSFLFLATVVSSSGLLTYVAKFLEKNIPNSKILLIVIMLITSLVSGLVSAGPAAAAMLPVIVNLCNTTLAAESGWVAIAYAASICAGSSLFLWSATAGFILSSKIDDANLGTEKEKITWGIKDYFKYGIVNYFVQMAIAILWIILIV